MTSRIQTRCWHLYPSAQELLERAEQAIVRIADQAIAAHGAFHIVLAGGNTPRALYQKLRGIKTEWHDWHIYFGDERCLPPEHAERNSLMAYETWLSHVEIPAAQIHPIPAELGPEQGAAAYAGILREVGKFDLVLLGLGEDGHTASLFPGHDWGVEADAPATLAVHDSPKPPPQRISLSAQRLGHAWQIMFLVTGVSKKNAVADWRNGVMIPAASIAPQHAVEVLIDGDAFG